MSFVLGSPRAMYIGADEILKSLDGGETWLAKSFRNQGFGALLSIREILKFFMPRAITPRAGSFLYTIGQSAEFLRAAMAGRLGKKYPISR
jgi:hypothetical protein